MVTHRQPDHLTRTTTSSVPLQRHVPVSTISSTELSPLSDIPCIVPPENVPVQPTPMCVPLECPAQPIPSPTVCFVEHARPIGCSYTPSRFRSRFHKRLIVLHRTTALHPAPLSHSPARSCLKVKHCQSKQTPDLALVVEHKVPITHLPILAVPQAKPPLPITFINMDEIPVVARHF